VREAPTTARETSPAAAVSENCGCKPFTEVVKNNAQFEVCAKRAEKIGALNTPRKIYALIAPDIAKLAHEEFYVLGLGAHGKFEGKLMTYARVGHGGQHKVQVETGSIVQILSADRPAIYVLCHPHPSGDSTPSDADIEMTEKVRAAVAEALPECKFGDHLIICATEFYSIRAGKKYKA
jgi:DNA repair protein RadC